MLDSDDVGRGRQAAPGVSLRVELDDQLLLDRHGDVLARRRGPHRALERRLVQLQPARDAAPVHRLDGLGDAGHLLAAIADVDDVAGAQLVGGDGDLAAVDAEVAVLHQLARLVAAVGEAEPEHGVVEPELEPAEQVLAGAPLGGGGAREGVPEARLEQAVHALDLLLLAQLDAVLAELDATLAVLSGRVRTALDGALVRVAAVALQVHLQILAAAEPADAFGVTSHCVRLLSVSDAPALGGPGAVVRDGRDVLDERDLEARRGDGPERRLAARARALDHDHHRLEAVLHGLGGGVARRHLGGERRGLARALEAARAGRRPGQDVPGRVGDGDHRVVEGGVDVHDPVGHVLLDPLLPLLRGHGGRGHRLDAGQVGDRRGARLLDLGGGRLGLLHRLLGLLGLLLVSHAGSPFSSKSRRGILAGGRCGGRSLAHEAALRALAGAGVGVGALAADRKPLAVAEAAVAAQVHEALDVHGGLAAQVALDLGDGLDGLADVADLIVVQVLRPRDGIDPRLGEDLLRGGLADPVDVLERDLDALFCGEIDAGDASHSSVSGSPGLALG